jgi:hypothetical protein
MVYLTDEQLDLLRKISDRARFYLDDAPTKVGVASTLVAEELVLLLVVQTPWGVDFELSITPNGRELLNREKVAL